MEDKHTLRSELRKTAAALRPAYLAQSNAAICRTLVALEEWKQAKTLFCYVSFGTEPETRPLIEAAFADGKRVCVPRCRPGGVMEARQIRALSELRPAPFGLREPDADAPLVPAQELELVVAPCVAADADCWRLGNGGGYYDRYLPAVRCPVVCLCRGKLLQQSLPRAAHDIRVAMVLTEDALYRAAGV